MDLHRHGPIILAGAAIAALVVYLLVRDHKITGLELILVPVIVFSVILHEISHGLVAYWCGDDTAKRAGRLTLNPLRHIDPIGTIVVPIILVLQFGTAFGWAKPVPVSINRLRHPRNQSVLVSLAGPFTNIILAAIAAVAFRIVYDPYALSLPLGTLALYWSGLANVVIAAFNLIPIPPLDGSAVVERLLPVAWLPSYYRVRSRLMLVVIGLVLVNLVTGGSILAPLFNGVNDLWGRIAL